MHRDVGEGIRFVIIFDGIALADVCKLKKKEALALAMIC